MSHQPTPDSDQEIETVDYNWSLHQYTVKQAIKDYSKPILSGGTYPEWICNKCGKQHGRRLPEMATWHQGKCDLCQQKASVTEPRDFGHLKGGLRE